MSFVSFQRFFTAGNLNMEMLEEEIPKLDFIITVSGSMSNFRGVTGWFLYGEELGAARTPDPPRMQSSPLMELGNPTPKRHDTTRRRTMGYCFIT